MSSQTERIVRTARGAGQWFPASRKELEGMVNRFLDQAQAPAVTGRIVACFAPHAGYQFSGKVAGYTFRALRDNAKAGHTPDVVVVVGLSHGPSAPGVALMDGYAMSTPLGEVLLDRESSDLLSTQSARIQYNYTPHMREHSAENLIPFVQAALPGMKIVVAILGDHSQRTLADFVEALKALAAKKKIVVAASTDMLHDPDYDLVTKTDKATLEKVAAMDTAAVYKSWDPTQQVFCGIGPVLTAMRFAESQGCKKGTVLYYRNNGDDDPSARGRWVVGYGAVVFVAPEGGEAKASRE
jgi:hypothetical protein